MKTLQWLAIVVLGMALSAGPVSAQDLKRADYTLTLPANAKVDAKDSQDDPDHYTSIDLPNDGLLIMVVVDDKAGLSEAMDVMQSSLTQALRLDKVEPSKSFAVMQGKGVRMSNTQDEEKHLIDVGSFAGRDKGYIMVYGYTQANEKSANKILQDILGSLRLTDAAKK